MRPTFYTSAEYAREVIRSFSDVHVNQEQELRTRHSTPLDLKRDLSPRNRDERHLVLEFSAKIMKAEVVPFNEIVQWPTGVGER